MEEIDIKKMPFELSIDKVSEENNSVICKRYFMVKKPDLTRVKTIEFAQLFSTCVQMVEKAIADASAACLMDNNFVFYANNIASLSPSRYSAGDVVYIRSENDFYEYVKGALKKIEGANASYLWNFAPDKRNWTLTITLAYHHPNKGRLLLSEASIDVSNYPRCIATQIDLTGKRKYWEQSRSLIYHVIGALYKGLKRH
jgi:hypothetical protein